MAKHKKGPYRARLDPLEYIQERIPRRHGRWFCAGTRTRHRIIAVGANMRIQTDMPIRDPDNPPPKLGTLTYKGMPLMTQLPENLDPSGRDQLIRREAPRGMKRRPRGK